MPSCARFYKNTRDAKWFYMEFVGVGARLTAYVTLCLGVWLGIMLDYRSRKRKPLYSNSRSKSVAV